MKKTYLLLWNYINFDNLSGNPIKKKGHKLGILALKMHTGSRRLWFCKIIPEAAWDKFILARIFPTVNERLALENINHRREENFEEGFSKRFQND